MAGNMKQVFDFLRTSPLYWRKQSEGAAFMGIAVIFLLLFVLCSGGQMCFNKMYQTHVKNTLVTHFLYLLLMGVLAAVCFFLLAGCDLSANLPSLIFAFVASLLVIVCQLVTLTAMAKTHLAMVTVATNASTVIWPSLFGVLFLHERISLTGIIGILLIVCAVLVPFFFHFQRLRTDKGARSGYIWTLILFLVAGHGNSIHKAYTASTLVTASNNAYLSWLNIFMVPMIAIALLVVVKRSGITLKYHVQDINLKYYGFVVAGTVIGCFGMVFSMQALSRMDVSLYSPLYSSVYIVFLTLASKFIFKEELQKADYISVFLALVSVVFSAL